MLVFEHRNTESDNTGRWSFEGRDLDDATLSEFLDTRVLPHIEKWRQRTGGVDA